MSFRRSDASLTKTLALACAASVAMIHAAAAQSVPQFDLVCTGTMRDVSGTTSEFSQRFAIDLDAGLFCFEGCRAAGLIAAIEPARLVLKDDEPTALIQTNSIMIIRTNGAYFRTLTVDGRSDFWRGTCTMADFTPMPRTAF